MASKKQLFRSKKNRMLAGICGGMGEYFDTDPTLVRLIAALIIIFTGFFPGLIVYIAFAIIIPER